MSFEYINLLKQEFPLRMIDQILSCTVGQEIQGCKTIFPADYLGFYSQTRLPLFILVETMGQLSEILIRATFRKVAENGILAAVNKLDVINDTYKPGQTLLIHSRLDNVFRGLYQTKVTVRLQNTGIAQAILVHTFR